MAIEEEIRLERTIKDLEVRIMKLEEEGRKKAAQKDTKSFHLYTDTKIEIMHVSPEEALMLTTRMVDWVDEEMAKAFEAEEIKGREVAEKR